MYSLHSVLYVAANGDIISSSNSTVTSLCNSPLSKAIEDSEKSQNKYCQRQGNTYSNEVSGSEITTYDAWKMLNKDSAKQQRCSSGMHRTSTRRHQMVNILVNTWSRTPKRYNGVIHWLSITCLGKNDDIDNNHCSQ